MSEKIPNKILKPFISNKDLFCTKNIYLFCSSVKNFLFWVKLTFGGGGAVLYI
jgi:hypothetical protein